MLRHAASGTVVSAQATLFDLPVDPRLAWHEVTVRGKQRLLCERCGGTVAVPKGAATPRSKGHDVQHARSSIVELRIGRRQLPVFASMEATLRKYGGDAVHDQWGTDTARELGLPIVSHGSDGMFIDAFEGLPWSLHWAERDVVGEVLPSIPNTAPVTRAWLAVWSATVDLVAATNAPWWLCAHVAVQRNLPFHGPSWVILDAGVAEAPELAERIAALGVVAVAL